MPRSTARDYTALTSKMPPVGTPTAPPTVEELTDLLRAVIDPELGGNIVDLGMTTGTSVSAEGDVAVGVKLTIAGCPLRGQIKRDVESRIATHPGVRSVTIDWGEMTPDERSDVMLRARWAARENAPDTEVPASARVLAIASGKGGVGKSSVTVNLAAAIAAAGYTVGVLDADIWGFSVPRMLGMSERLEAEKVPGRDEPKIIPNEREVGPGRLKVVSTGMLVEDEGTALDVAGTDAHEGRRAVPARRPLGSAGLPADRHAAGNRGRADGAGPSPAAH